ncbi:hypothetical protein K458DRAFT_301687 [Lentithecium fluviatile CBS 122367]|uniref:DUF3533 domain-containing protein n=1 Tax=Lentithecium fluviatile CBS 122367 TaxID=1168545 RepID=A0A6G1J3A2_9PLEO|nr:hypothetical protein K458DRAFT_301687 [Lentithecium fluviatile CBS 122367]
MPTTPTLGCQIAPHYSHDAHTDSESDTSDSDSDRITEVEGRGSGEREEVEVVDHADLEKAETQQDSATTGTVTRPTTLQKGRTKSSRRGREERCPPVGFWHWQMAGVRLHVLKLWFRTNLILAIAIFSFLCLFWGALFNQENRVHNLKIWVVDFDSQVPPYNNTTAFVGLFVTRSVQALLNSGAHNPGYTIRSPSDFDNDPVKVRQSIYDFHAWAAVIINANATTLIERAVRDGNTSYDPLGACQIIFNSARDQTTTASYISPSLTALQKSVVSSFGREWLTHLMRTTSAADLNLDTAPQAITPGIEFTMYDLRPFGPPIATPAVSIGLIYLIILSFFSFTFFLPIHMKYLSPRNHPPLHFTHLIIWRYVATVTSYFFLSFVYSLVSLAFLMPMDRPSASPTESANNPNAYGRGTFPVYWVINWVGMTALGLASENMAMLLGTPWTALWLIFWVISNVATGFYSLELASGFYRWGYAWPMHNIAELTRQTLFNLHSRTGLNFGILFAWVVVGTGLFPICCYYMRWNTARVKKNAAKAEQAWKEKMEKEREEPSLLARVTTRGSRPER